MPKYLEDYVCFGTFNAVDSECFDCRYSNECSLETRNCDDGPSGIHHSLAHSPALPAKPKVTRPVPREIHGTTYLPPGTHRLLAHTDFRPYPGESTFTRFLKNTGLNMSVAGAETLTEFLKRWDAPPMRMETPLRIVQDVEPEVEKKAG